MKAALAFPAIACAFVLWLAVVLWSGAGDPQQAAAGGPEPLPQPPAEPDATRSLASSDDGWAPVGPPERWPRSNPWIRRWTLADTNIHAALHLASRVFGVSYGWLHGCVHSEGGHVSGWKLRRALRLGTQPGWNTAGSYAFGPFQFMLDTRPAPASSDWGTFGAWDDAAFSAARVRGEPVPYRFKRPDSNVGQAVVGAFMFRQGHSGAWTGAGC